MAETEKLLLTEFDAATTSSQLQVIKAFIPFAEYEQQRFLALIVRIMELNETMDFYNSKDHAAPLHRNSKDTSAMFKEMSRYCSKKDAQMFDMFANMDKMKDMMKLFETFSQTSGTDSDANPFASFMKDSGANPFASFMNNSAKTGDDDTDMLKNMLSPEQQEMYESYMKSLNI